MDNDAVWTDTDDHIIIDYGDGYWYGWQSAASYSSAEILLNQMLTEHPPYQFDWVDISSTYDGELRPYAESLGYDCEQRQTTDSVNGVTRYYLYFTKEQVRATVVPKPASGIYSVFVGKVDENNGTTRVAQGASANDYKTLTEIKAVLQSAS